jgi:hypothetical protein
MVLSVFPIAESILPLGPNGNLAPQPGINAGIIAPASVNGLSIPAQARRETALAAFVTPVVTSAGRYRLEGLARVGENNSSAGCRLLAPDNEIDVEWIELDAAAHSPGVLGMPYP